MSTRPSGLEERDGEIRLQRKWASSLVNDKAAIPVPRATQDPGDSKRYQNSPLKREARRITGKRAAGLRRYAIQLDEEWGPNRKYLWKMKSVACVRLGWQHHRHRSSVILRTISNTPTPPQGWLGAKGACLGSCLAALLFVKERCGGD